MVQGFMATARIGTEFAGYRIEALLGRGATSTVYRAEDPRLRIPIALKLLNPEAAADESFRERFVREFRLVAGINHPNIIPIYDAGVWEDSLYIAMRYVAGGDLKARIRGGPLAPERALTTLAQVAGGLDAAHARGLVHRDVKPANIMVDAGAGADAPEVAYVTDFGLIKSVETGGAPTATGELLGTIDYVAPEQIEGRPVDGRTDVYSLGCVAFECLTGRVPFDRDNEAATLWAHMQEEPPSAVAANPRLPRGIDRVLERALAKSPDDRFATCGGLVEALRAALVRPAPRRARVEARSRRRPRSTGRSSVVARVAPLAGALLLGAGAAAAALVALDDDPRAAATVTHTVVAQRDGPLSSASPEAVRDRCEATGPPTPDFSESFACRPGRGVDFVRYSHALSGPLLTEYFNRRMRLRGLVAPGPTGSFRQEGSCGVPIQLPAVEEWRHAGRAGHEDIGRARFRDADGRVLCYRIGERARIEWATTFAGYYALAEAASYSRLLRWWRNEAGPIRSD